MPRKGHKKFSDKRVQVPKKLNQQMKRLHDEGKKMDKIIEILQLGNIPRSKFTEREKKYIVKNFSSKKKILGLHFKSPLYLHPLYLHSTV